MELYLSNHVGNITELLKLTKTDKTANSVIAIDTDFSFLRTGFTAKF